jgi:hypothetical protein
MAETTETERYRAAWQDRRTRLRAIFAVLFAFAVLLYAVPSAVVAGVGIIATLAASWRYASFRCPRCSNEFLSVPEAAVRWPWRRRDTCQRCGLRDGADPLSPPS